MINDGDSQTSPLPIFPEGGGMSVHRLGTVKLFTFSFEIDAPNIISCAPKNLHLVAQVLPNSNLNFKPWCLELHESNSHLELRIFF